MKKSQIIANGILKSIAVIVGILAAIYAIYELQIIVIYLAISLVLCLIGNPTMLFLVRKLKFSSTLAASTIMFTYFVLLLLFANMLFPLIFKQAENLSLLNFSKFENQFLTIEKNIENILISNNIDTKELLNKIDFGKMFNLKFVNSFFNSFISTIANFGMGCVSVFFITFFLLKDQFTFKNNIIKLLPKGDEHKFLNTFDKINQMLSRYFIGLLIQISIVFILDLITLFIFGIENAFTIAFICALLNLIPYIGPVFGTIFAAILTMTSNLGLDFQTEILPKTIYVVIGFMIVQFIDNNLSQPIIFSKSVNSHPLEIFLVTIIAGTAFGITGMIIAIPIYTMFKIIAKEFFPNNRFVEVLTQNL